MDDSTPVYAVGGIVPPSVYVRLKAQPAVAVGFSALGADQVLTTKPCILVGWSAREASGSAAASFKITDGTTAGGQLAVAVNLATSGTDHEAVGADGLYCDSGLFFDFLSGSVDLSVWIKV